MIARNPTALEVEAAADVAWMAFGNMTQEHWRKSFQTTVEMFGVQFILVVEMDGRIVSSMVCHPAPVYVAEQLVSHASAGAVGTLREYRNQGCAAALMTECVKILRAEDVCLSSLWPFSYPYYRKFGWEVGAESRVYGAKGSFFGGIGGAGSVRQAVESDLDAIKSAFESFQLNYNCLTQRSDEWWKRISWIDDYLKPEPERGAAVHVTDGDADGYVVYSVVSGDHLTLQVKELVFAEPAHRLDMLTFLGEKFPEHEVEFTTPADDLFLHEIPDPRAVRLSVQPAFQFRVVDPKGAMLAIACDEMISGKLSFKISDPVFESGHTFGIDVEEGSVSLCEIDPSNTLEMDVQTFAKLYSGYLTAGDAWFLGRIKMPKTAAPALALACEVFSSLGPYRSWLEPG